MTSHQRLEAPLPPELLGRKRNTVKLLSINRMNGKLGVFDFKSISDFVEPGDVLVFNNSKTVRGSIPVYYPGIKTYGKIHIGTSKHLGESLVEPRPRFIGEQLSEGSVIDLLGTGKSFTLQRRHKDFGRFFWGTVSDGSDPLQVASAHGTYIRYDHIPFDLPEDYYSTQFSKIPGSVEFPSASRPFTSELLGILRRKGVLINEITLHCNLGSMEPDEFMPKNRLLNELYSIPTGTSEVIREVKERGHKVIAVGTSVVRALESATFNSYVRPGRNGTELYINPGYEFKIVDSIITGMHEDTGSHIGMISAFSGPEILDNAYSYAADKGFLWHEFGDLAFIC